MTNLGSLIQGKRSDNFDKAGLPMIGNLVWCSGVGGVGPELNQSMVPVFGLDCMIVGTTSMDLHPTLEHNTIIDIIGWLSRPTQLYIPRYSYTYILNLS